ncbi:M28 family peptidase [Gracilinema caldarium]|uniref:Peptidase M28 domain-containing protein n=1 Tax=Gracilinema caldarium (strain ATCC 51460 / DSM 7334 / H1) TaxID=744872 RepID=F8F0H2_GRAC1|nr:M28 family peptidase [Gracilinema caldarium]AEJ19316.1 hypothetical protein Spica_1170 [Gracilinema caldarium DSM 7334]
MDTLSILFSQEGYLPIQSVMNETEQQFFHRFTEPYADRYTILWNFLAASEFAPQSITLAHTRHILLSAHHTTNKGGIPKVLIAHYDCVPGSPGANDNAAAVLQLILAAKLLYQAHIPNWYILFTDKEERARGSSITSQGSFYLAQGFISIGLNKAHCYIFDACGRGDTLIFSTALEMLAKHTESNALADRITQTRKLRTQALTIARSLNMRKVLLAPTPFSDDLGFLTAGLTAQTITILPEDEAQLLLQHRSGTTVQPLIKTWQLMNSPEDTRETLTREGFDLIPALACALCGASSL